MKKKCFSYSVADSWIVSIYFLLFVSINDDSITIVMGNDNKETDNITNSTTSSSRTNSNGEKILSRHRRYLIFPEGSSLQLVADSYHPVVDYANVFIVGITAAMAWELPHKPVYLEQELQEAYKNGEFLLIDRIDSNVQDDYNATTKKSSIDHYVKGLDLYYNKPDRYYVKDRYYANVDYYNNKHNNNKNNYFPYGNGNSLLSSIENLSKVKYDGRDQTWTNSNWRRKDMTENSERNRWHDKQINNQLNYNNWNGKRKHYVHHPIFRRKRNINQRIVDREEKFNLNLHRTTRQHLYKIISKFIQSSDVAAGMNCVQKALCETAKRHDDTEPDTFFDEIMRTIFSMPDSLDDEPNLRNQFENEAHESIADKDCKKVYHKCRSSIWSSNIYRL